MVEGRSDRVIVLGLEFGGWVKKRGLWLELGSLEWR